MQTYYPLPQGGDGASIASGVLTMAGTIDPATNAFNLVPGDWLFRPSGHAALGISGTIDADSGVINGRYDMEGCGAVNLRRLQ